MGLNRKRFRLLLLSTGLSVAAAAMVFAFADDRSREALVSFFRPQDGDWASSEDGTNQAWPRRVATHVPEEWKYYLPEKRVRKLMQILPGKNEFDPWTCTRELPDQRYDMPWPEHRNGRILLRTNHIGLREDAEIPVPAPDIRVLVAGDSHTYGVCENAESFPNQLEGKLRATMPGKSVEVLNAAVGGYTFYNYFGTLLRFRSFKPQVFVVAVYSGNDFGEMLYRHHAVNGSRPSGWTTKDTLLRDQAAKVASNAMGQCYSQIQYLAAAPQQQHELALSLALQICGEMQTVCKERDITMFVCVLPSPSDLPHHGSTDQLELARKVLQTTAEAEAGTGRLTADFIDALGATGIPVIDMRATFAAQDKAPYWERDLHLDVNGHRLIAEALAPAVEAALK